MKSEPEEATRPPPEPYMIDGAAFYNARQATQIIQTISEPALRRWVNHGTTPFGLELDVRRVPTTHHRRSTQTPRAYRQYRPLIPAAKVQALQELLRDAPLRPGPISGEDMEALETAARRFRPPLSHQSNSPSPV
jgi:hypothetical protein